MKDAKKNKHFIFLPVNPRTAFPDVIKYKYIYIVHKVFQSQKRVTNNSSALTMPEVSELGL